MENIINLHILNSIQESANHTFCKQHLHAPADNPYSKTFIKIKHLLKNVCRFFAIYKPHTKNVSANTIAPEAVTLAKHQTNAEVERLLNCYGNRILRLAYSYLHNRSDAEDILQDTFIQYLKSSPAFSNQKHEKAWLFRVAANLCKNKLAYNQIRETDELEEQLHAEGREDLSFVWEAVKELPDLYREVIHLYHYEGYSTSQIADILGRKESTIRSNLKRGREKLKSVLKEEYDFG